VLALEVLAADRVVERLCVRGEQCRQERQARDLLKRDRGLDRGGR